LFEDEATLLLLDSLEAALKFFSSSSLKVAVCEATILLNSLAEQ